ncbi:hypothetical protein [Streptomyces sp. NPDC094049]|uniref:hypothetical protein n=1 Tax=Streptomyces sp. NPDC094049 TaxID=3154987 RepID=UPI00333320B2
MREDDASIRLSTVVAAVRTRLEPSHPALKALRSTAEAIDNAEPELALDDLCQIILFFDVRITPTEYDTLRAVSQEFLMTDLLEGAHLLPFIRI